MAIIFADVIKPIDTEAQLEANLREKQVGFANDGDLRMVFKHPNGEDLHWTSDEYTNNSGYILADTVLSGYLQGQIDDSPTISGTSGYLAVFTGDGTILGDSPLYRTGTSIGLGTIAPDSKLHILKGSAGTPTPATNTVVTMENNNNCYLSMMSPSGYNAGIYFGNPSHVDRASIICQQAVGASDGYISIQAGLFSNAFTIYSGGKIGIVGFAEDSFQDLYTAMGMTVGGNVKNNVDAIQIDRTAWSADMDGTETSILFRGASGIGELIDGGRLTFGTETDWTSTASTQDSYFKVQTALNGVVAEKLRVTSSGNVGVGIIPREKLEVRDGSIYLSYSDIAHGRTTLLPTDVYGSIGPLNTVQGGLNFYAASATNQAAMWFMPIIGSTTPTVAPFTIDAYKTNAGTSWSPLTTAEPLFDLMTDASTVFRVTGGGNVSTIGSVETPKVKMTAEGGIAISLINNTGGTSVVGQIVEASGTLGFKTADANDAMPIGICYNAVANGASCWVVVAGIADVLIDAGGCTIGDWVGTGATSGSADCDSSVPAATQHFQEIGHALATRVGAGLAKCVIHFN